MLYQIEILYAEEVVNGNQRDLKTRTHISKSIILTNNFLLFFVRTENIEPAAPSIYKEFNTKFKFMLPHTL